MDLKIDVEDIEESMGTLKINVHLTAKGDGWRTLYEELKEKQNEVEEAEAELVKRLLKMGES